MGELPQGHTPGRLTTSVTLDEVAGSTAVIEAVTELADVKAKVLAEVSGLVQPGTVLVTNTSSFPIDEMADAVAHPQDLIGTHFMNPAYLIKTVEVIRGRRTSDATLAGVRGRLVTMDISEKWPSIGAPFWREAHVADRIDLRVGDAQEPLAKLRAEEGPESFDLAFVDTDKAQYAAYYEAALDLLRPGGLIVLDNTLFFGRVIDPAAQDADTVAIRELNQALLDDDRVDLSLLPLFDGITLARKRSGAGGPSEEDRPSSLPGRRRGRPAPWGPRACGGRR